MTNFLGDRIIDDQGNVRTIAGGQDAKLYYIDLEGNRKPYLIEGEGGGGGVTSVNGQKGDVTIDTLDINYVKGSDPAFTSFTYYTCTQKLANLNIVIPAGIKNSMLTFETKSEFAFTLQIDASYKINKPFEFETDSSYIIAVDNNTILWSKIETIEG